ncbi:sigma-54 dependent transcriptional regulator [Marinobacter nanhaiticus D15-8W]|nr:sigma-54 dependent transcriptional regulator [Marinobacter nanhaiticus]BES71478.1 sigma-54 dependent transcriptional regulator [Marinobacter nanhaiticus D15-8W]
MSVSDLFATVSEAEKHSVPSKDDLPVLLLEPPGGNIGHLLIELRVPLTLTYAVDQACRSLQSFSPATVLVVLDENDSGGLTLVRDAVKAGSRVIVSGPAGPDDLARKAVEYGASEFLARPVARTRLWSALGKDPKDLPSAHEVNARGHVEGTGGQSNANSNALEDLKRASPGSLQMKALLEQVTRVAPTMASVLITGESGTGKEVTARAIHEQSRRYGQAFIPVNCGAIPPQLIESELFGHERGSFTGAVKDRKGLFERADGGTLFLDEITEMPVELQVKLLRVLETYRFCRVGSERELTTDVRVVAATNRDPDREVAEGRLRADLLYRLRVFPIELPPLRERKKDIRTLAQYFLQELNRIEGCPPKRFTNEALAALEKYRWPGNLRELKNVVRRMHIMATGDIIDADQLPDGSFGNHEPVHRQGDQLIMDLGCSIEELERVAIIETLAHCDGHKERAARVLGISDKTLYNRLKQYDRLGFMSRKCGP